MSKRACTTTDTRIAKKWCTDNVYKLRDELMSAYVQTKDTRSSDYWWDLYKEADELVKREKEMTCCDELESAGRALDEAKKMQEERLAIRAKKEEEERALHLDELLEVMVTNCRKPRDYE